MKSNILLCLSLRRPSTPLHVPEISWMKTETPTHWTPKTSGRANPTSSKDLPPLRWTKPYHQMGATFRTLHCDRQLQRRAGLPPRRDHWMGRPCTTTNRPTTCPTMNGPPLYKHSNYCNQCPDHAHPQCARQAMTKASSRPKHSLHQLR